MKKTLTLFLIGAMAIGSAFTFSSCSAGKDDETSPWLITLNDFIKAKKRVFIEGLVETVVVPEVARSGAQGAAGDTVYASGYVVFANAEFDSNFVYRTDELDHEDGEPRMAWLWITFSAVDAATSPSALLALGMDPQGTGLVGEAVLIQLNYTTHEAQVLSSTQGTVTLNYPDPMGEYVTFDAWIRSVMNANFFVEKAGREL